MPYLYYHGSMDRLPLLNKNVFTFEDFICSFIHCSYHSHICHAFTRSSSSYSHFPYSYRSFLRAHFIMIFTVSVCVWIQIYSTKLCEFGILYCEGERAREKPLPISILWITICIYHLIACTPSSSSLFILLHFRLFVQMKSEA